jgi:regulator of RNase E activity RraA
VNFPVSVGGIVVNPGDLIVGDIVGVVVVPREYSPTLLRRLRAQAEAEADYLQAVAEGRFSNAWVDITLADGGVTGDDDPSTW